MRKPLILKQVISSTVAATLLLATGFVVFERDIAYASSFAIAAFVVGVATIMQVNRFKVPSWRAGIPIYYLTMFFVIPIFQQVTGFADYLSVQSAPQSWLYGAIGILSFCAFSRIGDGRDSIRSSRLALTESWPFASLDVFPGAALCVGVGAIATVWSVNFGYYGLQVVDIARRGTISGIISALPVALELGAVVAWCHVFGPRRDSNLMQWWILGIIATSVSLYFGLYSNSKAAFVKPVLIIALSFFSVRRRLSWPVIIGLVMAYTLVVYPFVTTFRMQYSQESMSGAELFSNSVYHLMSLDWLYGRSAITATPGDSEAFGSLGRGLFLTFASINESTDHQGTLGGATFAAALAFMVPRALWPDKPDDTVGNFIGHFIGVLHPADTVTNVSPTQMGEFYMNFGLVGLVLGMAAWGVLSHWVDRRLTGRGRHWSAVFLFLFVPLQEASVGQGLLAIVKSFPVYIALAILASVLASLIPGREGGGKVLARY